MGDYPNSTDVSFTVSARIFSTHSPSEAELAAIKLRLIAHIKALNIWQSGEVEIKVTDAVEILD